MSENPFVPANAQLLRGIQVPRRNMSRRVADAMRRLPVGRWLEHKMLRLTRLKVEIEPGKS